MGFFISIIGSSPNSKQRFNCHFSLSFTAKIAELNENPLQISYKKIP